MRGAAIAVGVAAALAVLATAELAPHSGDRGRAETSGLLFAAPIGFHLQSTRPAAAGGPGFYGATRPTANWNIAQWQNPGGDVPAFAPIGSGAYRAQSATTEVTARETDGHLASYELSQDGATLACAAAATGGDPPEFDLFAQPNGNEAGNAPTALVPGVTAYPGMPLTRLSALRLGTTATITRLWNAAAGRCAVNQRGVLLAVILDNYGDATHPSQTLFYEIYLYSSRCDAAADDAACSRATPVAGAFYIDGSGAGIGKDAAGGVRHQEFNYGEDIAAYGLPALVPQRPQDIAIDVLGHVQRVLRSGPNGLEPDLAHWFLVGAYHGQQIWGKIGLSTAWTPLAVANGDAG